MSRAADSRAEMARRQRDADRDEAPFIRTPQAVASALRALIPDDDAAETDAQCSRLLTALRAGPVTTVEAVRHLDIVSPSSRVATLRKRGHEIESRWVRQHSAAGRVHRFVRYVLTEGAA